jgi:RNA polymerase sigma factor (TIGR02999 family)
MSGAGIEADASEHVAFVYDRLRRLARSYLARERDGISLCPTDLVHEAYARLAHAEQTAWRDRTHFFAVAARQMRHVLIDLARRRVASKRGGARLRVTLDDDAALVESRVLDLIALDQALDDLAARNERQYRVAELRLFGGLLLEEIARQMSLSERTVRTEWRCARAWLAHRLHEVAGS